MNKDIQFNHVERVREFLVCRTKTCNVNILKEKGHIHFTCDAQWQKSGLIELQDASRDDNLGNVVMPRVSKVGRQVLKRTGARKSGCLNREANKGKECQTTYT